LRAKKFSSWLWRLFSGFESYVPADRWDNAPAKKEYATLKSVPATPAPSNRGRRTPGWCPIPSKRLVLVPSAGPRQGVKHTVGRLVTIISQGSSICTIRSPSSKHMMLHKGEAEIAFWKSRLQKQGVLTNDHFEYFYTTHFGLDKAFYRGKKIVDIGCGPRGSLEWATEADIRIGIDPLASMYRQLGTGRHSMRYVACGAENLPFSNITFDVVSSFNSLDHVDDLSKVIDEIRRVLVPRGYFLLLTDIHRDPTVLEPIAYSWDIVGRFLPELEVMEQRQVEQTVFSPEGFGDIYQSLQRGTPYNHNDTRERSGILSVKFRKCDRSRSIFL